MWIQKQDYASPMGRQVILPSRRSALTLGSHPVSDCAIWFFTTRVGVVTVPPALYAPPQMRPLCLVVRLTATSFGVGRGAYGVRMGRGVRGSLGVWSNHSDRNRIARIGGFGLQTPDTEDHKRQPQCRSTCRCAYVSLYACEWLNVCVQTRNMTAVLVNDLVAS